jgi:hypothetical protein
MIMNGPTPNVGDWIVIITIVVLTNNMAYFRGGVNCGVLTEFHKLKKYIISMAIWHTWCTNTEMVDCFIYLLLRGQEPNYINLLPIAISTCVQTLLVATIDTVYYLCQTCFSDQFIVPVRHLLFLRMYNSDD